MSITPHRFTEVASSLQTGAASVGGASDQSGDFAYWERLFDAAQGQGLGAQHHTLQQQTAEAASVLSKRSSTSSAQHGDLPGGFVPRTEVDLIGLQGDGEDSASGPSRSSSAHWQLARALPTPMEAGRAPLGKGHGHLDEVPLVSIRDGGIAAARLAFASTQVLAPFEAHLHRNAQGGLLVTLRSAMGLSDAQALGAVAEALGREGQAGRAVACVLLNGRPIYQAADGATSVRGQFEIEC